MIASLDAGVALWWALLGLGGVLNIALWLRGRAWLSGLRLLEDAQLAVYRRSQWLLAGFFVVGCASRSWIIRADVQRIAMLDTPLASVAVGRTIATLAETAFVAQWALFLDQLAKQTGSRTAKALSRVLVPLILIAETCSWMAVLTTNYLGNVCEESIWALTGLLFMIGLVASWRHVTGKVRQFVTAAILLGVLYVLFMVSVDVPMYLMRWHLDESTSKSYLGWTAGLRDATRVVVTGRWSDWREEMPWMSLYFTAAVWMSLALVFRPVFPGRPVRPCPNSD
jgi:hypothetical protein